MEELRLQKILKRRSYFGRAKNYRGVKGIFTLFCGSGFDFGAIQVVFDEYYGRHIRVVISFLYTLVYFSCWQADDGEDVSKTNS